VGLRRNLDFQAMKTLTLRQATILRNGQKTRASIKTRDGRIAEVGDVAPEGQTVDLDGLLVLPGVIDAHVHAREPGATHKEDFRSVSEAALAGGVTTFLDMPNNKPATTDSAALQEKRRLAAAQCLVHHGFFLGATGSNVRSLNAIANVPGIKVYLGSSTGDLLIDNLRDFTRIVAETTQRLVVHAEDEQILRYFSETSGRSAAHHELRDPAAAVVAVAECCLLAERFGKRVHLAHISTKEEVGFLRLHKTPRVTCEVCPHHLFLSSQFSVENGGLGKVNPPLRDPESLAALWDALQDGLIDIIATDHAPHTLEEKRLPGAPSGVPGIETSFPLMLDAALAGKLSLQRLQDLMCVRPAEIFGMAGKGRIEPGYDADLCVVDVEAQTVLRNQDLRTKCRWTPFDGRSVRGRVVKTFVSGVLKFEDGRTVSDEPATEVNFAPDAT
jgi:dihydroorotase